MAFGVHDQGWRSMLAIELPPPYPIPKGLGRGQFRDICEKF
jgi:hypothetical protein